MGAKDAERQRPNVSRMELFGARVVPVESGSRGLKDALNEALRHAGIHNHAKVEIEYVDAESLTPATAPQLAGFDAILVPGGFGKRGIEGKIVAAFKVEKMAKGLLSLAKRSCFLIKDGKVIWQDYAASTDKQAEDIKRVLASSK